MFVSAKMAKKKLHRLQLLAPQNVVPVLTKRPNVHARSRACHARCAGILQRLAHGLEQQAIQHLELRAAHGCQRRVHARRVHHLVEEEAVLDVHCAQPLGVRIGSGPPG
jgi:hypothetical protein